MALSHQLFRWSHRVVAGGVDASFTKWALPSRIHGVAGLHPTCLCLRDVELLGQNLPPCISHPVTEFMLFPLCPQSDGFVKFLLYSLLSMCNHFASGEMLKCLGHAYSWIMNGLRRFFQVTHIFLNTEDAKTEVMLVHRNTLQWEQTIERRKHRERWILWWKSPEGSMRAQKTDTREESASGGFMGKMMWELGVKEWIR